LVPPAGRGNPKEGVVATLALSLPTPPAQDIDGWLCAEVLRVALAEPNRGLLYEGEPPFGRLVSEYLPRRQGSLIALYALPPVQAVDDWQAQTRQRLERALQQIAAGEHRAALEGARATVLARHTAAMRNPLERARWHGLCAILNLPLTPEAFAERLCALPLETIEAFAARLQGESSTPPPAAPAQTPPPSPALPDLTKRAVARQRLANGLRVIALTAPDAESVIVQVAVGHALGESPAAGELTMRMLFGATQNETERTLAMRIAQSGGSLRIEWTPAGALITAYARPDSVVNVLSLLKEALFRAEFSDDALQRARQHALYDRRYQEGAHAWRLTARLLGGYADEDALARVRLDDIRAYYRAHYRPQNAVIAIAGNVPAERLTEFVRLMFGGEWDGVGALPCPHLPSSGCVLQRSLIRAGCTTQATAGRFRLLGPKITTPCSRGSSRSARASGRSCSWRRARRAALGTTSVRRLGCCAARASASAGCRRASNLPMRHPCATRLPPRSPTPSSSAPAPCFAASGNGCG
jgi:hypothetical protein